MSARNRKQFWVQFALSVMFASYLLFWFFEGLNNERLNTINEFGIAHGIGVRQQDASRIAFFQMVIPENVTESEFTQGERWIDVSDLP